MLLFHTVRSPCFGTRIVDLSMPLLIRMPLILPCFVYAVMNLVFDVFFTMVTNFNALYACLITLIISLAPLVLTVSTLVRFCIGQITA